MVNSLGSCISNTSEESTFAPEVSISEMVSQPGMFFKKFKGAVTFKQLKGFANSDSWRQLNKQVDVINSDVKSVNFTSMFYGNLVDESFTIHPQPIKLKGIFSVFNFPDISKINIFDDCQKFSISEEMESISSKTKVFDGVQKSLISDMSKFMFKTFQIHFFAPKLVTRNIAHANFGFISGGLVSRPSDSNHLTELNFEDGDSSQNLKVWVSSPWM